MYMHARRPLLAIGLALAFELALTDPGSPQSLGELARSERERGQSQPKKAKKVYTNDDFPARAPTQEEQTLALRPPPGPEADKPKKEDPIELERRWRQRFAVARAHLREAEQRCWRTRIHTVFVGGGGLRGMQAGSSVPVQMQVRECVETEELRQAGRALADMEEELRRAGLPPGWARE
jgi:hypothetical protein